MLRYVLAISAFVVSLPVASLPADQPANTIAPIEIGSRRELFVDDLLVDKLQGTSLKLHSPQRVPAGETRPQGDYSTLIIDDAKFRMYGRRYKDPKIHWKTHGLVNSLRNEVTTLIESQDGIHWSEPNLGLFDVKEFPEGNVIIADQPMITHNFTPFIDVRPGVAPAERYKALAGLAYQSHQRHLIKEMIPGGLYAFVSADGIHWKKLQDDIVIPEEWGLFDSQNIAFWSVAEGQYVCYFRTFVKGFRSISRTTSQDFLHWSDPQPMQANLPEEHLYTSCVSPYFRAPHIYLALPTRFQAKRGATTDIMLMSTRGDSKFERTFKEAFIRPGVGKGGWGDRSNYAALNLVPTSDSELSIYLAGNRRYVLRYDGFASVNAPYEEGEMLTKPFVFSGKELELNYSTSAAGRVRVEIQDADGKPIPGFTLDDCPQIVGDEIEHVVAWKDGSDVSKLAGQPVRLRFVMQDADLFSLRFR